ncbi:uncharacterized protein V6R79_025996 [Siganus canaliculatus]
MRLLSFRFGCMLVGTCFVCLSWIRLIPSDGGSSGMFELRTLYKRLLVAEELGGQVSRDLSSILEQLRNVSKPANITCNSTGTTSSPTGIVRQPTDGSVQQMLPPSNMHLYMPHLRQHPDSLLPNVVLGQGRRGVSIVMGIPTVKREKQSYLVNTLSSLLFSLTPAQQQDLLIIVFVAEADADYVNSTAETIKKNFPNEVRSGLVEVVSPSQYFYPDFTTLRETFGDSKDRVKWRTKQNLDFSFLMLYAQDKGTYYVQLEDDVVAKTSYYQDMKTFAVQSSEWLFLEFSQLGFIGKMFRTSDLPMIAEFFLMFHKDKPIDWLLDHILWVKVCHPEKDSKHCSEQKAMLKKRHKPSLFQHVGLHSSLPGKVQRLQDKDFGKQVLHVAHPNPAATLSSNLQHYQQHSLDRAYRGEDFFWALTPSQNSYILFSFNQPVHISGYLFRSGNAETSGDKFYNTTVEVLPSRTPTQDQLPGTYKQSDSGFFIIGEFKDGIAEGHIEEALQPVSALRLVVQSDADVWALLSEIHIKV